MTYKVTKVTLPLNANQQLTEMPLSIKIEDYRDRKISDENHYIEDKNIRDSFEVTAPTGIPN